MKLTMVMRMVSAAISTINLSQYNQAWINQAWLQNSLKTAYDAHLNPSQIEPRFCVLA